MKLLRSPKDPLLNCNQGTVLSIGNFDGVHLGHQSLLQQMKARALQYKLPLVILLFEPQPGEFFKGQDAPARLSTLREKLRGLGQSQVDYVYCLRFNAALAAMSAHDFAKEYIFSMMHAKYVMIGEDFRFGKGRQGDVALLQDMGLSADCVVETISDCMRDHQRISSTKIREALAQGRLQEAEALLGRPYSLCGRVIRGAGRGQLWGIPTANIAMSRARLPLQGVFAVQVRVLPEGSLLDGVANLGRRPTVDGTKNVLEVHLFDYNGNLYGKRLEVIFKQKIRAEIKFESQDALIQQIHKDVALAKNLF